MPQSDTVAHQLAWSTRDRGVPFIRLGEKPTGCLEDVIGPAQFLDFALQCLELLAFAGAQTFALAIVNFVAFDPVVQ